MPMTGSTIFSHIVPVIFGFVGLMLIMSGIMDNNKPKWALGIVLFVIGCAFPYVVLNSIL